MWRKTILWIISKLYSFTYEEILLDKVNKKLIRPVPGLVIGGRQYYEFVNLADMPETRRQEYVNLREEMVMGIDRELLVQIIDTIIDANDKDEKSKIGSIAFVAKDMLANITTMEQLYKIASVAYFDETEDLASYDLDYNNRKIEKFKTIANGFFFTRLLSNGSKNSSDPLRSNIDQLLKEGEVKMQAYHRILSDMLVSKNSGSTTKSSTATAKATKRTSKK